MQLVVPWSFVECVRSTPRYLAQETRILPGTARTESGLYRYAQSAKCVIVRVVFPLGIYRLRRHD